MEELEQHFSLVEGVDFLQLVCVSVCVEVLLSVKVHFLQDLFFLAHPVVVLLLENMPFEVVFMVGFPWLATHVTKTLATKARHIVTACRPLDGFIAPWAYFCV